MEEVLKAPESAKYWREMSDLEHGYARFYLKAGRIGGRFLLGLGGVVLLGLLVPVGLVVEGRNIGPLEFFVLMVFLVVVLFGGWLLIRVGISQKKITLLPGVYKVKGVLEEASRGVVNPNTGYRQVVRKYLVGDVALFWPLESESICLPYVGRNVEVYVAIMESSFSWRIFKKPSVINAEKFSGIVLGFYDVLDVDAVLSKYGKNYFLLNYLKGCSLMLAMGGGFICVMAYTMDNRILEEGGTLYLVLFYLVVAVFMALFFSAIGWLYRKIRKAVDPDFDVTSHEERLKG